LQTFRSFSLLHAIVVLVFAALCIASSVLACRYQQSRWRRRIERAIGWGSLLIFIAVNNEFWLRTDQLRWDRSMPLHVCDLSLLAVPLVLIKSWRPARVVLYYFGLGLSTQGFITPDLDEGPLQWPFWSFWLLHFAVVGTAIYDLAARGFRPTWRDLGLNVLIGLAYLAIVLPLDIAFSWNYGYVGPVKPEKPTMIDVLGSWPDRVFVIAGLAAALMTLMTLPWELVRKAGGQRRFLVETREATR
jgi:hypothetical integral membrane protein (TIGR02206 family)